MSLIQQASNALETGAPLRFSSEVRNINRTVGTMLGSELTRRYGSQGLPDGTISIDFTGSAGQSFGAFLPRGITLRLEGDANDYVGKGLSGGRVVIRPAASSAFVAEENIIAGNVVAYGATSGEVFIRGVVGERFCAGEMQLPFVLESAEAMKAAIRLIEPRLPREANYQKGRMLLATVKGDVHDIGKNLVDIILSNNGFEVKNLGIKQPIEAILKELETWPADAIGLSGLLVKSTVIMKESLHLMEERGLKIPVILGGAALTRDYVEGDCRRAYSGAVLYAEDAFEGLRHMQALVAGGASPLPPPPAPAAGAAGEIKILRRGGAAVPLSASGQSSWVRHEAAPPTPPFWGVRELTASPEELFPWLDEFALIRNRWGFSQGSLDDAAFAAVLREKAEPQLARWRQFLADHPVLRPRARYGYFSARAEGEALCILDPKDPSRTLTSLAFPRQATGRRLCLPDFFRADGTDVVALQLVSLGQAAADHAAERYAKDGYADYFAFHGLATELTEAYAEALHARIRQELGIQAKDLKGQALFAQGYQGSRYSPGYPACPDLETNGPLLDLLDGAAIGVHLSESHQMDPEYSTSALVAWHPQARYFSV